jgi:ketosteroid isomerase-like protein
MANGRLTKQEKRNLELVREWAKAWEEDSVRMVDEVYADATEVFIPLQDLYWAKRGKSKANWRAEEAAIERHNQIKGIERKMSFVTILPRGDTVAVEVAITHTTRSGRVVPGWFAAFLTFDKDGRIIVDHTYMRGGNARAQDPSQIEDAELRKAVEEMRDAFDRARADQ